MLPIKIENLERKCNLKWVVLPSWQLCTQWKVYEYWFKTSITSGKIFSQKIVFLPLERFSENLFVTSNHLTSIDVCELSMIYCKKKVSMTEKENFQTGEEKKCIELWSSRHTPTKGNAKGQMKILDLKWFKFSHPDLLYEIENKSREKQWWHFQIDT